jgi:3-dehydroquinate synthase
MLPDNILFSLDPSDDLLAFLHKKNYSQLAVLMDENTLRDCYPIVQRALPDHHTICIKPGEGQKNLESCTVIWQKMTEPALDRHACMIIIGGGVLGDMGGFCAATYKRGIDFILVPTTLLSQADASIGGKLGIDFHHFKNHIGVFQQPALTLLYEGFLRTLPQAELRSGFAEVIKHALISDHEMWDIIAAKPMAAQDWRTLVMHSVSFKARITTEDPKEKGIRKILNAGHTIGHAVESYLLAQGHPVLHGEAIAIGIMAEGYIALERQLLSERALKSICTYMVSVYGRISFSQSQISEIAQLTIQDKKNKGNRILCVLLEGIGKARWDCEISLDDVKRALTFYTSLQM